ncbi:hypothetical protein A3B02_01085 [Candidatus Roizmanbacteria bacterium RIFCSPLOWO2_01_FULL_42_14]|uniref:RNA-binding S4 domain-containing protein n=3 Tax=Candidatus Roizmaniibacteriota TaxID=1752723 RepID=A0A1F7JT78_9BACT|nr:MAG: hypothetical protein A3D08_03420 [Candidatus Roizmanbacteria bacterium RIFCSPHIGHO2_02_FULL_43_11]OGK52444.1 MAG: hypothetical protein A3B02_01085 [Candidatus Roizmanbacteria bacterium RIFCSPLOWO2_01_FULL_42_14]OGK58820.1 MAG: hypothetical protein A3I56_03605 [Candidatus Roizmanbacteria bacterium RIFCSPLOWO2_02_FULL_43_10]
MRINQFLSQAGIASRRGADELIKKGSVRLNGKILLTLGTSINTLNDVVEIKLDNGMWEGVSISSDKITYALYKPRGYVTSTRKQGRAPIITSLLPREPRVFPIGRLDKESEGLILCTNDGEFAVSLTHPRSHVPKKYRVHCTIPRNYTENILKSKLGRIAKGVKLDNKRTLSSNITLVRYLRPGMIELEITLREGRNRQIRRMLGKIDLEVIRLIRTDIGNVSISDLQLSEGKWVELTGPQKSLL